MTIKQTLWIASKNTNKINEIKNMLKNDNIKIKSLLNLKNFDDISEIGKTIESNSLIKAKTLSDILKKSVIADDSGLEIMELNNFPGVYSKRWAFPIIDEIEINKLLLQKCINLKSRSAILKSVITYYDYNKKNYKQFIGILLGKINDDILIGNGFGYDSIFLLENNKLISEISLEEKNKISHRAKAMKLFLEWWKNNKEI